MEEIILTLAVGGLDLKKEKIYGKGKPEG